MHTDNQIGNAGSVQFPGESQRFRFPDLARGFVAHHIGELFVVRLYHSGNEIPTAVHQFEGRCQRLVEDQRTCGVVKHDSGLAGIQGQIENRLSGTVAGVEDRTECIAHRVSGRVHPTAHNNALTEIGKDAAVIGDLQMGLFRGRIVDVESKLAPLGAFGEVCSSARPVDDGKIASAAGFIQKRCIFIRRRLVESPQAGGGILCGELTRKIRLFIQNCFQRHTVTSICSWHQFVVPSAWHCSLPR